MLKWFHTTFIDKDTSDFEDTLNENFTYKILHDLKYNRSPLTIGTGDDTQAYASLILEIDAKKEILVLDELFPQEGNKGLRPGQTISIKARNNGVNVTFECGISKCVHRHGLKGILVQFPQDLDYMQRRDTFRVSPPQNYHLKCQFRIPEHPSFVGRVNDLSLTGLRMTVPQNIVAHLKPNMLIQEAKIVLPTDETIQCNFKLCHLLYQPEQRGTVIGGEFKGLSSQDQRKINRTVTDLQRMNRSDDDPNQTNPE